VRHNLSVLALKAVAAKLPASALLLIMSEFSTFA
jgi:hypothetical protein